MRRAASVARTFRTAVTAGLDPSWLITAFPFPAPGRSWSGAPASSRVSRNASPAPQAAGCRSRAARLRAAPKRSFHEQDRALTEDADLVAGRSPAPSMACRIDRVRAHHHEIHLPGRRHTHDLVRRFTAEHL